MKNVALPVEGMTCGGCVRRLEKVLRESAGVKDATVHLQEKRADVAYDETLVDEAGLVAVVERAGFDVPSR